MRTGWVVLACCAALVAGCSSGGGTSSSSDSGSSADAAGTDDAQGDASPSPESGAGEAGVDATAEAGADATLDATADALADGALDGSGDVTVEAGGQDSSVADSATPEAGLEGGAGDAGTDASDASDASDGSAATDGSDAGADASDASAPIVLYEPGVVVSTLAGNGSYGEVDGPDASFQNPTGIALYASGVIVVENDTGAIRAVSGAGVTQTLGTSPVDQAQTSPYAIVAGPQGYFYSTDFDQSGVKVDGGGAVWSFVLDDAGAGTSSRILGGLYEPRTLVPLPGGDIFVFDTGERPWSPVTQAVAERLNPSGPTLTFVAGQQGQNGFANGDGGAAVFGGYTFGGVLLPDGSAVVVADCSNSQLRRVGLDGVVSTFAGSTSAGWVDGPLATARFSCPHALAIDAAGNIYVGDWNNNAIRRISASGNVTTLAGDGTLGFADGPGNTARFYGAEGMVVSADGTTLYVADGTQGNGALPYNRIRAVSLPALDGG